MKILIRCAHCGIGRMWERGSDGIDRPEQTLGPLGVGHYPYTCASPAKVCEPRRESSGDRMVRELHQSSERRGLGVMTKQKARR